MFWQSPVLFIFSNSFKAVSISHSVILLCHALKVVIDDDHSVQTVLLEVSSRKRTTGEASKRLHVRRSKNHPLGLRWAVGLPVSVVTRHGSGVFSSLCDRYYRM